MRRSRSRSFVVPLILLSIPWAVGIHTVTAFLYNGLAARPFWNASILAPRFLSSAFCSGPAMVIIIFQVIRKVSQIKFSDEALFKIAELIDYALFINLFLLGAEVFKEYYSNTIHLAPLEYLYEGLHGHRALVPWMWLSLAFNVTAFLPFPDTEDAKEPSHAQHRRLLHYRRCLDRKRPRLCGTGLHP